MIEPNYHTVTVTSRVDDEGTGDECRRVDDIGFTCTAPEDAECRRYPDCECERWSWGYGDAADENGHERTSGHVCWLKGWFGNDGAVYVGEDADDYADNGIPAIDRTGHITVESISEWIEWKWL